MSTTVLVYIAMSINITHLGHRVIQEEKQEEI